MGYITVMTILIRNAEDCKGFHAQDGKTPHENFTAAVASREPASSVA
jgi:hypothetical protein